MFASWTLVGWSLIWERETWLMTARRADSWVMHSETEIEERKKGEKFKGGTVVSHVKPGVGYVVLQLASASQEREFSCNAVVLLCKASWAESGHAPTPNTSLLLLTILSNNALVKINHWFNSWHNLYLSPAKSLMLQGCCYSYRAKQNKVYPEH